MVYVKLGQATEAREERPSCQHRGSCNHAAVFVCVDVKGALSCAGLHRDWLLSIQSSLVMRDNGLNVSIHFKGLLVPNKAIQDLVEGKMET